MFAVFQYLSTLFRLVWLVWLWLWMLVCVTVFIVVLLFSRLPDYRVNIEQWLTGLIGQPVTIGEIVTYWEGWQPTLVVQQIRVHSPPTKRGVFCCSPPRKTRDEISPATPTELEITRFEISLNLLASLQQQQLLTARVELRAKELTLLQSAAGDIRLSGLSVATANSEQSNPLEILPWLLQQSVVSWQVAKLTWVTANQPALSFTKIELSVQKQGDSNYLQGQVALPPQSFHGLSAQQFTFSSTLVWDYGRLSRFDGQFYLRDLHYVIPEGHSPVVHLEGQLTGQRRLGHKWQISVNKLALVPAPRVSTASSTSARAIDLAPLMLESSSFLERGEWQVSGQLKQLSLAQLSKWFTATQSDWQSTLNTVQGELQNIEWSYRSSAQWQVRLQLKAVTAHPPQANWPQFTLGTGKLQITSQQGHLAFEQLALSLQPEGYQQSLSLFSVTGQLQWQRTAKYWLLTIPEIQFSDQFEPSMQVQVVGSLKFPHLAGRPPESVLTVTAKNFPLTQLRRYLPTNQWPTTVKSVTGTIQNLRWIMSPTQPFELQGEINNLGVQYEQPNQVDLTVRELTGQFKVTPQWGSLKLQQAQVTVNLPQAYSHPLSLTALHGEVSWKYQQRQWHLKIAKLHALTTHQIPLQVAGSISIPESPEVPYLNLRVSLQQGQLENVAFYLPDVQWKKVLAWFHQAKLIGKITSAQALLKGPVNALFDPRWGQFKFTGQVQQAYVQYDPKWPAVTEAEVQVAITGPRLVITASKGKLLTNQIRKLVVSIDNLKAAQPVLDLVGKTQGPAIDGLRFLDQSPLQKTVGVGEKMLGLEGPMELQLTLAIPLFTGGQTQVDGKISFQRNTLQKKSLGLTITQLKGVLQFTQDSVSADRLQGKLFNQPLSWSLLTLRDSVPKRTRLQLTGKADAAFLTQLAQIPTVGLQLPLSRYLTGRMNWQITIHFPNNSTASTTSETQMVIASDLVGLGIALPSPLAKLPEQAVPLLIEVKTQPDLTKPDLTTLEELSNLSPNLSPNLQEIRFRYGDLVNGVVKLDAQGLFCGQWVWGTIPAQLPQCPLVSIVGVIPPLVLTAWQPVFEEVQSSLKNSALTPRPSSGGRGEKTHISATGNLRFPIEMDVRFKQLVGYGQQLDSLAVQSRYTNEQWEVAVTNDLIEGQIRYRFNQSPPTLELNFQQLSINFFDFDESKANSTDHTTTDLTTLNQLSNLKEISRSNSRATNSTAPFNPRTLPIISFYCNTLKVGPVKLGAVNLSAQPTSAGLDILAEATTSRMNMLGKVQWQSLIYQHQTVVQGSVTSDNTGQWLHELGLPKPPVQDGISQIIANAQWPGPPWAFNLATLRGRLSILLLEGQLLPVEPGIGRLFGLFDWSALPKRLALDFHDVFAKGLGFNSIVGFWVINNGVADIDKLLLQGPIAQVEIQGRTHLVEHTYNQVITVTPHLSNAIPVIGTIVGGPGVGATTLVMQQMLQAEIEKSTNFQYQVTGSWEAPVIEKVGR